MDHSILIWSVYGLGPSLRQRECSGARRNAFRVRLAAAWSAKGSLRVLPIPKRGQSKTVPRMCLGINAELLGSLDRLTNPCSKAARQGMQN